MLQVRLCYITSATLKLYWKHFWSKINQGKWFSLACPQKRTITSASAIQYL